MGGSVSLSGSLDSFSLDEVLSLIAAGRKTGTLQVRGDRGVGAVYFNGGRACGAEAGRHSGPIEDVEALLVTRLQDVCFELFRFTEGDFIFEAGRLPEWAHRITLDVDIQFLVAEVKRRVSEWAGIQAIIPSAEARPKLVSDLPFEDVTVDRWQWRLIAAIDGRRRVNAIMRTLHMSEFDCCRAVKALVEAELVEIELPGEEASGSPMAGAMQGAQVPAEPQAPPAPREVVRETHHEATPAPEQLPSPVPEAEALSAPVVDGSLETHRDPPVTVVEPATEAMPPPVFGGASSESEPGHHHDLATTPAASEPVIEVNLADQTLASRSGTPASLLEQGLEDPLPRNGNGSHRSDAAASPPPKPPEVGADPMAAAEERPVPGAPAHEEPTSAPLEVLDEAVSELRSAVLRPVPDSSSAPAAPVDPVDAPAYVEDEPPATRQAPVDDNIRAAAAAELAGLGMSEGSPREESRRRRGPSLSPVREA